MKKLPWILVILLAVACVVAWFRPHEPLPAEIRTETKIKTVVKVDTLLISPPMAPLLVFQLTDTIRIGDTVVYREQAYYEDSLYRAWVSGYRPRLDSLMVFPKTVYQTVRMTSTILLCRRRSVGDWDCKSAMAIHLGCMPV